MIDTHIKAINDVLDVIFQNHEYFASNPTHLAWVMHHKRLIEHDLSKQPYQYSCYDWKGIVTSRSQGVSRETFELIWDSQFAEEPKFPLAGKRQKTMADFEKIFLDPVNPEHADFRSVRDVYAYLLILEHQTVSHTGYYWTPDGFLEDHLTSGTEKSVFAGFSHVEDYIRRDIFGQILTIRGRFDEEVFEEEPKPVKTDEQEKAARSYAQSLDHYLRYLPERVRKMRWKDGAPRITDLAFPEKTEYPELTPSSNLITMPPNAHESYVTAGLKVVESIERTSRMENRDALLQYARKFRENWK